MSFSIKKGVVNSKETWTSSGVLRKQHEVYWDKRKQKTREVMNRERTFLVSLQISTDEEWKSQSLTSLSGKVKDYYLKLIHLEINM